ncbi:2-keto-3-deoxygluconate permease [Escherichia coli]
MVLKFGFFAGLSTLALVAAMDITNGEFPLTSRPAVRHKRRSWAFLLMSLESGPLMTMIIWALQDSSFEPHVLVSSLTVHIGEP